MNKKLNELAKRATSGRYHEVLILKLTLEGKLQ